MKIPKRITVVTAAFKVPSVGQQLLDRLLMGYPADDGTFHLPANDRRITLCIPAEFQNSVEETAVVQRQREFGLQRSVELHEGVSSADAILIVPPADPDTASGLIDATLAAAQHGVSVFVHGTVASTRSGAARVMKAARERNISIQAGTALEVTWNLPVIRWRKNRSLTHALIVVQGDFPEAEVSGLHALLPLVETRRQGETGVDKVIYLHGPSMWERLPAWAHELLGAALSRSNSPLGNSVLDGRTEDLLGLGMVPKLAKAPRAWLLVHTDGFQSCVLALTGVVADINVALRQTDADMPIVSTQIYRPPPPARHEFSRLMERLVRLRAIPVLDETQPADFRAPRGHGSDPPG